MTGSGGVPVGDTIAARATPPGRGGVAVVRVSGPGIAAIAEPLLDRGLPAARRASLRGFLDADGTPIDDGLVLYFPGPNSFTGEDVLELHGHGGEVVVGRLLARLRALGVREAEPGEFSRRAFINGRMDLSQAEAIADLIDARSEAAARAALRSLNGEFGQTVHGLTEATTRLRIHVESAIDFPDEAIDIADDQQVRSQLAELEATLDGTLATARRGRTLRDGMQVVIIGHPNVGKSSLLNRLAGEDTAIVTEIPGTTRDTLREDLIIDGMPLQIVDTAGLRDSGDPIEQEGVRRAWQAIHRCDRVLLVTDAQRGVADAEAAFLARLPATIGVTVIRNKIDLAGEADGEIPSAAPPCIRVSATLGVGIDALRAHLRSVMGAGDAGGEYSARQRHIDALERARHHLAGARAQAEAGAGELMAEELGFVQAALGEITGEVTSDDLLGRIFATFCIGK
jgi:tRNA modification GTPase